MLGTGLVSPARGLSAVPGVARRGQPPLSIGGRGALPARPEPGAGGEAGQPAPGPGPAPGASGWSRPLQEQGRLLPLPLAAIGPCRAGRG